MGEHIEMIIDYVIDGADYQYFDNKGLLTRCKDCQHYRWFENEIEEGMWCLELDRETKESDYCSFGKRKGG